MHSSDEHLSSASQKQRQSLPARSFTNYDESKSNAQLKESSSDEDDEENSTVDNFDTNYDNFKPQHLSLDYNASHLSPISAYQQQNAPGSNKKSRSLSIASILSPLSPSNSENFTKKNVPQFLTVSPTFTPRARPPQAYANNFVGSAIQQPSIASPRIANSPSPSRQLNSSLLTSGGRMPSFEAARGGILGSATSQLLNSRSRHQSIGDTLKISSGNNQVLSSHLARKRQSVVSAKILETLASANANYSGMNRRLIRGQTCYGSGSGASTNKYFSPSRFTEGLKESYDEEQDEIKKEFLNDVEQLPEKKISIEAPLIEQRASILTTATTRTYTSGDEKENQIDEELLSSKMEDTPILDEQVKLSIDASDKLSRIKENDNQEDEMSSEDEEPEAPTYSLGERVVWVRNAGPEYGTIRWIGRMPKISAKWTVGLELDNAIGNTDGRMDGKRYFSSKENYAKFLPLSSVSKIEAYLARPRSGTLLSRMSVQLKPGQLISIQRTPSINHIPVHCALNAPHHIDHDVHEINTQHCLCNSCNHPCAHLCHTKNAKGSKKKERAHMCHFSQKPHGKQCCGGEELRKLILNGKLEKVGGLLQEVKENQIAVAASKAERMQALKQKTSQRSSSGSRISTSQIGAQAVGSVGSAAIGAGFNTIVVGKDRRSGQSTHFSSLTPPPPSPPAISPLPRLGLNPSHDSSTLGRESRRKAADRSSAGSRRLPSSSAPSSVERVSVCSLSSCSKKEKHTMIDDTGKKIKQTDDAGPKLNGQLQRSGSELSISSLPSTTSPVEVYIARGALTDESEYESDLDNKNQTTNLTNLDKSSHVGSHISKHSGVNSYYGNSAMGHSNIYQPHHRSAIRSMFACLVGRQQPNHSSTNYSISSKENYSSSQRAPNYYYDAGLDGCVRRKKTKKSKKKSNKKKRSCKGQNSYCYYCTSHNYPSSASQAPSRTSNQSTTTTLQTAGAVSHHSNRVNLQSNNLTGIENGSLMSGRNLATTTNFVNQTVGAKSHHLNVKNSCGLSPSPEPDSQQALLSNYSDRSSCHSHHSINSSNYKDYITNYCSKTSSYNHDCHPECSRKNSQNGIKSENTSLPSVGKVPTPRTHTQSPMQISCSPPNHLHQENNNDVTTEQEFASAQKLSNAILVNAETHDQQIDISQVRSNKLRSNIENEDLGEIVNTKDPQPLTEQFTQIPTTTIATVAAQQSQPPTQMDFVEQLHQFQQQYLKQHPEVIKEEQLVQSVATECNDPINNQQQQQQIEQNSSKHVSGTILQMSTVSSGPKQMKEINKSKKENVSAQDINVVRKKIAQNTDTVHKQKANSSNVSISSSTSSKDDKKHFKQTDKKLDDKKLVSSNKSISRPNSRASDESKKETKVSKSNLNQRDLNKSAQSIQVRPESKRSNKTDLSSNNEGQDSTTNSILSLNSNSLGIGQCNSITSDQIATTCSELTSVTSFNQLDQSQTSISSSSINKTNLPSRTINADQQQCSTTTSTTSITSRTISSSNTSGVVTSSPIRRRKKPPAPKPPLLTNSNSTSTNKNKQRAQNISSSKPFNASSSSKVPINSTNSNLALSHSNSSFLMINCTDKCNSLASMNLKNTTTSDLSSSSADINSLKRRKKSSKNRPAPPIPTAIIKEQQQKINQEQNNKKSETKLINENKGINLTEQPQTNSLNKIHSSSCSKQLNKRINNNNLRLTPCMSVNHRNKSNVKLRLNAILNRSLSEAFRLNAKAALNSVQHSFSSEVSLNKRNLSTMINNTAFTDSFGHNEQHQMGTPEIKKKKKLDEVETKKSYDNLKTKKDSKKSDVPKLVNNKMKASDTKDIKKDAKLDNKQQQINNWRTNNNTSQRIDQCNQNSSISPFTSSIMDRSFINSNRLVNQLFTTQPDSITLKPVRRCSSLPYLAFFKVDKTRMDIESLTYSVKNKANRKRTSSHNVANDLIIETLSNNLYNGSADQLLYAAELLETLSEQCCAVPPLSSSLAALLSPHHYQKHNLNNQLLLINHYIDCLKHEQEQEELLTVQLIEQQQVNRMMIEINKEQECIKEDKKINEIVETEISKEISTDMKKATTKLEQSKPDYIDKLTTSKTNLIKTPSNEINRTMLTVNGHESGTGSDELHSDTSDGKVTVKSMPAANRTQELTTINSSKQVTASSSGLSNSSSKTLLATNSKEKTTTSNKQDSKNLEHLKEQSSIKNSNFYPLNKTSSTLTRHRHHYCSNKNIHCLMHSQSSHCLNEHSICHHHHIANTDESSSSSSQSTKSTEELNWSKHNHQFNTCPSIGLKLTNHLTSSHFSHSLRPLSLNYLNASSSECSTDESCSADSPMLMHHNSHHKNCLQLHSNNFKTINNDLCVKCACCEHRTQNRIKSGVNPNQTYLFEAPGKQHFSSNKNITSNYNQEISNLYDYHSLQLEDMFNAESSVLINQELTDLMEALEIAISSGEHKKAALLARELALRKCACTLQRSTQAQISAQPIVVYLYIEDLNNHVQGPIPMQVYSTMTVRDLKLKVQKEYGFDVSTQKWVLGKSLASNDDATLFTYGLTISGCPIFLYIFSSEELYAYNQTQHFDHHHFLTDSLPSLLEELNEESLQVELDLSEKQENTISKKGMNKSLDKKLSASLDTSLGLGNEKKLNKRLDKSLDTNLNRNKTIDRKSIKTKQPKEQVKAQSINLVDEMLDLSTELNLPPPIDFQSDNEQSARLDLMDEPLIEQLVDTSTQSVNWINNKLHENLFFKSNKLGRNRPEDEQDEYESASEELIEGHSIEEDRSIEEILIEEEVYELNDNKMKASTSSAEQSNDQGYKDLIKLDDLDLVPNKEQFECKICLNDVPPNEGVILKECLHSFCKNCLISCIEHSEQPPVLCPFDDDQYHCESEIRMREIRALFNENSEKYEQFLKKSIKLASLRSSSSIDNLTFLCKTPDCDGFCFYKANTRWFLCPLCSVLFCLSCQEAHNEEQQCKLDVTASELQATEKELTEEEKKSERFIQDMVEKGQAIHCPKCNVVQIKKWGCDLIKCTMCKTEICWITRKTRWGPNGKGDISDGCRCMVNNKKCHPKCNYCH